MVHQLYLPRPAEPPTPEAAYAEAFHACLAADEGSDEETAHLLGMIVAIWDQLASLDAELGRLTESVRRLEGAR